MSGVIAIIFETVKRLYVNAKKKSKWQITAPTSIYNLTDNELFSYQFYQDL